MIHTVKGIGIVNKAEVGVSLELSCFFDEPMDVGNLVSGSFAFSKSSLNLVNPIELTGASQVALVVKSPPVNAGDSGSIPGSRRSPGEENGSPLQCSCL